MEITDLRLGNLVNRKYWNPEPNNEKYCYEVGVVTWISQSNINVSPIISREKFRISKNDIIPVPLTEYWVRKFGFTKTKKNEFESKCGNYSIGFYDDGIYFFIAAYMDAPPYKKLDYVHEFQNLHFALSNKELALKESLHNNRTTNVKT